MKINKKQLFFESVTRFVFVAFTTSALLFLSAGTVRFINGWIAIGALLIPVFLSGLFFYFKNPEMLYKRTMHRENDRQQKHIVTWCAFVYSIGMISAGLTYRLNLMTLPVFCKPFCAVAYLMSIVVYILAYKENPFLSKTVVRQENQFVVDTGIYGKIRHPFYLATSLLYFSISIALDSALSTAAFLLFLPALRRRITLEEKYLINELPGYDDYMKRVPYKLIPKIW